MRIVHQKCGEPTDHVLQIYRKSIAVHSLDWSDSNSEGFQRFQHFSMELGPFLDTDTLLKFFFQVGAPLQYFSGKTENDGGKDQHCGEELKHDDLFDDRNVVK